MTYKMTGSEFYGKKVSPYKKRHDDHDNRGGAKFDHKEASKHAIKEDTPVPRAPRDTTKTPPGGETRITKEDMRKLEATIRRGERDTDPRDRNKGGAIITPVSERKEREKEKKEASGR